MSTESKFHYSESNLHQVLFAFFNQDVQAFFEIFESNEEAFVNFLMTTLNILGKPHEVIVYRTNPADGPVKYIGSFPYHTVVDDYPIPAFHEVFCELTKLMEREGVTADVG
jgi:hypothetical protein